MKALEAHLTGLYFAVVILLLMLGFADLGAGTMKHIIIGWVFGIAGVGVFVTQLAKPAAKLATGAVVAIPKGYGVPIIAGTAKHHVTSTATLTVVSKYGASATVIAIIALFIVAAIATVRSKMRKPAMPMPEGPPDEHEGHGH